MKYDLTKSLSVAGMISGKTFGTAVIIGGLIKVITKLPTIIENGKGYVNDINELRDMYTNQLAYEKFLSDEDDED